MPKETCLGCPTTEKLAPPEYYCPACITRFMYVEFVCACGEKYHGPMDPQMPECHACMVFKSNKFIGRLLAVGGSLPTTEEIDAEIERESEDPEGPPLHEYKPN